MWSGRKARKQPQRAHERMTRVGEEAFGPGQIVTVFRSRLREDAGAEYDTLATEMSATAAAMPGYVEHKVFTAGDGERVTLVTFRDRESHDAWRTHARHRVAQRRGREAFYATYSLQVAECTSAHTFSSAPD